MQVHIHCCLFVILLVFPFVPEKLVVAMASPLHTPRTKSRSVFVVSTLYSSIKSHTSHRHHNHSTFTHTTGGHRLATVVKLETWHADIPSTTETVTDTIKETIKLPTSLMPSDLTTVTIVAPTTSPTFSSESYVNPSKVSSKMAVNTNLGLPPTASPQITERRFFELPTATLIGVAVAASVAVNLSIFLFWLLLKQQCSRKPVGANVAEEELGAIDDTEKEQPNSLVDVIKIDRGDNPGLHEPREISPVQLDIIPSPSTHQPLPMPLSSFWSAASSQWTLERARSNDPETHLDEIECPRHFTTLSLNTPVNPHLDPTTHTDATRIVPDSETQENTSHLVFSPDNEQDDRTVTISAALRHSRGESSTDPRSPRRLSIPVFMKNYSSPSVSRYLPPQTQSTIITSNERDSYGMDNEGMLQDRESSRRVVEHELGSGSIATSMGSLASLPSESSEVMTPRRHWTFVDIHGPSAHTASPRGFEGFLDRLSATGSSQTLSGDVPGGSAGNFQSFSHIPFSEPSGTDSFLQTDYGVSTRSSFSQHRSGNTKCDTLQSFDHDTRTH